MNLIQNLKQPKQLIIASLTTAATFSFHYYLMSTLPGEKNLACVPGANLTSFNITISLLLSIATGLMLAGLYTIFQRKQKQSQIKVASLSGLGLIAGTLTMFCTFCTIPVISLFGLSIGLSSFTFYSSYFQILSLTALTLALHLLNKQLKNECTICKINA